MSAKKIGISDFRDFMSQGQPEWGIIAIKTHDQSALAEVGRVLARSKRIDQVPVAQHADLSAVLQECDPEAFDRAAAMVPVLRLKDSDWLLMFYSIGSYSPDLDGFAQCLSANLHARCIAFSAEDTSAAMSYTIYEDGDRKEKAEIGDTLVFESKERPRPNLADDDEAPTAFLDQVFMQNGVYLPACSPLVADGSPVIGVQGIEPDSVSEAYLLEE